ncbi:MAG: alpha/beta hydrolase, partial [SAR324 cluster bacterium]|nr:alpha/beta hydrolase [SAR324 cluster bacterium]
MQNGNESRVPLHEEMQEVLDFIASRGVPPHYELSPGEARENMEKARAVFGGEEVALPRVEELRLPGPAGEIPARLYGPEAAGALPLLVYLHGGGWVMGSLDTHDGACRRLAAQAGCLVVSVDYRLAPEHKFPAAVDDSVAAVEWIAAHAQELGANPARLAVGGDSAGGTLAAVCCQVARERSGPPIALQLLIYPATTMDFGTPSMKEHGEGQLLTLRGMQWFWDHYLNDPAEAENPLVSPLKAHNLAALPPAHVVTCGYDPLRDEGEAYAKRLREAGVPTILKRYEGLMHGFL